MAHPNLAQALGVSTQPATTPAPTPTLTAAAVAKPLTQHAAKETLSAQQKQQTVGQPQTSAQQLATQSLSTEQQQFSGSTDDTKTDLKDVNMAWQSVAGGATTIVTAGLALSSSPTPMATVESTNYAGSIQDNIEGDRTTTVLGKMSDSFLAGADTFTKGSASDTVLGMAGDTVIGLSSDALIGLAMPFTLISMGQVLLNMDEDVCVVHSKSFMLDIAGMKITTPGGATWGGKAAAEATDLEKAEKLLADAEKAEKAAKEAKTALEDAGKTVKAADEAKIAKTAADAEAAAKATKFEKEAKESERLQKLAKTTQAERDAKSAVLTKQGWQDLNDVKEMKALNKAADEAKKAAEAGKIAETAAKNEKDAAVFAKFKTDTKFASYFPHAAEDAKAAEKAAEEAKVAEQAAKTRAVVEKFGAPQLKTLTKMDDFFKAGFSVTKDSKAFGSAMKTLLKGFDYAAALKAVGYDADKALAVVKLTKASYISSMKIAGADNRIHLAREQSAAVRENADTENITKLEPPTSGT
jgi:hypothetical protein